MTPQDRVKRYAQLATLATILVWGLLCFFLIVSPKSRQLERTQSELSQASKHLSDMRKEIENASIVGTPAPGESRYEKFGILGADEEQLFLGDLIEFCKETSNTLNVVRRATTARRTTTTPNDQKKGSSSSAAAAGQDPNVPRPVVQKVPHTVNYSGTFLSSFYLLRKLESYKRLLTVERVEIATDTRDGYPRVNGNITIDLYLVRNAAPPPVSTTEAGAADESTAGAEVASTGSEAEADAGGQG